MATFPSLTSTSTYSPYHCHICTFRPISHLFDWFTNLYGQPLTDTLPSVNHVSYSWTAWPLNMQALHSFVEHQESLSQQQSITSQKSWTLKQTSV